MIGIAEYDLLLTPANSLSSLSWLATAASANTSVTPSPGSITEGILQSLSKK